MKNDLDKSNNSNQNNIQSSGITLATSNEDVNMTDLS